MTQMVIINADDEMIMINADEEMVMINPDDKTALQFIVQPQRSTPFIRSYPNHLRHLRSTRQPAIKNPKSLPLPLTP